MTRSGSREGRDAAKITRDDIEAKFREVAGDLEPKVERAKQTGIVVAVGVATVVVVVAYWMGRRSAKKRRTVLEIRRI